MSELERRHFRLLVEIDRRGTISAAARALHMTQSAASQQLRDAERRLGVALTRPAGRSVQLTPAARRLVEAAEIGEQLWSAAEADARWLASATGDTCKIAVGVYDTVDWIARLQGEIDADPGPDPPAPIELVRAPDHHGFDLLADGSAHLVVAPVERGSAFRRSVHLTDDELVGVVGTHHPLADLDRLTPGDFDGTDYVTYSTTPEDGFEFDRFLGPAGVVPTTITRVESISAIASFVAATRRVTILCRKAVPERPDLEILPLTPAAPPPTWTMTIADNDFAPSIDTTVALIAARWSSPDDPS